MQKLIAVFDGYKYCLYTQDLAIDLAKRTGSFLVGVFLDDFIYHNFNVYEALRNGLSDEELALLKDQDEESRTASVRLFKEAMAGKSLDGAVHRDRSIALQELLQESLFCDLMIIHPGETFTRFNKEAPTEFIRDLLSRVHCPVLLTGDDFLPVTSACILYDGTPSSVHALKMFSCAFSAISEMPVEVLTVTEEGNEAVTPNNRLVREYLKCHFQHATYTVLRGGTREQIKAHLAGKGLETVVVLGAYQRNGMSRLVKPSLADYLVHQLKQPVFIAHNKD